jgi:hypothetical protein
MFYTKDHKTGYIFDPWRHLGPKRRRLLEESWAGIFRQEILNELPVKQIAPFFSEGEGRPTKEFYTALGVCLLQQMHDLTDNETINQLAFNEQWHYALDIPDESDEAKYLCLKTLWNIRQRIADQGLDTILFRKATDKLAESFNVDTSKQRLDSVHIHSNMRHMGRIGIISNTIHKFLVNLRRQHKAIFESLPKELVDTYLSEKALACFSMIRPSDSQKKLGIVCRELFDLVQQMRGHEEITSMSSFQLLQRVLCEQCTLKEASDGCPVEVVAKPAKEIPSDSLQNPSDPEAGYDGHKGQGYQAQVMETYVEKAMGEEKALSLITHVDVEPACAHDVHALIPALEAVNARDLKPTQVLADSLYGSEDNLEQAKGMGVEVISPAMGSYREDRLPLSDFSFTGQGEVVHCPQGQEPKKVRRKKERFRVAFDSNQCALCPLLARCPARPGKKHHYLAYEYKTFRLARRRQEEQTATFKNRYRYRSGVEATMSALDRKTGIKNLRVRGLKAVRYCVNLKATGVNIFRAAASKFKEKARPLAQKAGQSRCYNPFLFVKEHFEHFLKYSCSPALIGVVDNHIILKCTV